MAVMGVIIGVIWGAAAAVYENARLSRTQQQILKIAHGIRSLYINNTYLDSSVAGTAGAVLLARSGVVPKEMWNDMAVPTKIVNAWGGNVMIDQDSLVVPGDVFVLSFEDVPQSSCSSLLMALAGETRDSGLIKAGTLAGFHTEDQFPLKLSDAAQDCASPSKNTVVLSFKLKGS